MENLTSNANISGNDSSFVVHRRHGRRRCIANLFSSRSSCNVARCWCIEVIAPDFSSDEFGVALAYWTSGGGTWIREDEDTDTGG